MLERQLDQQLEETTNKLKDIKEFDTLEYSQLKEIEEMCLRVKPAKTKSEIRQEIAFEKENVKFAKKVDQKINNIMKKLEEMSALEKEVAKEEEKTKKMEEEERK